MRKFILIIFLFSAVIQAAFSQTVRSLREIFPNLPSSVREAIFTKDGYCKTFGKLPPADLIGSGRSGINPQIINNVLNKKPGFLVESVLVIPDTSGKHSLLDVYNALGKIRGLEGRLYHSFTRNEDVPLFEEVTRLESDKRNIPINDPAPAQKIPSSETVYMRLKDVNFGNSYYRGNIVLDQRGLRYSLSNYKSLSYLLVPIIKEEEFIAQLYFEPIAEGILIYGLAGADVHIPDFVASRIDMASAISKRLAVIISWVAEGITR
jgi:hypothetical protein